MLGIQIRKPRFNLYHLDEGEIFIKEFGANCQFAYPETENIENLQGVLIIGSRSLIFEPDDHNFSMIKFHFRNIPDKPKILNLDNKEVFKLLINKMIEIPKGKVIQPYITHEIKSDLFVFIMHEKIEIVAQILYELFDRFISKQNSYEFDSIEYLANLYSFKFDYTRIKSINERFLIKKELFVKQILPLIEVPGLLMLTDARIYFQPIYALSSKKSFSYKYENTNKLFKRKIKLKNVNFNLIKLLIII